jgi:hypothetical protein
MYSIIRSIDGKKEAGEGCVRMVIHMGRFIVEDLGAGVRITSISDYDPMGMIPDFVKNMAIKKVAEAPLVLY